MADFTKSRVFELLQAAKAAESAGNRVAKVALLVSVELLLFERAIKNESLLDEAGDGLMVIVRALTTPEEFEQICKSGEGAIDAFEADKNDVRAGRI
jgi:hypothetical protein